MFNETLQFAGHGLTGQTRLPLVFGHFVPWFTRQAQAFALAPDVLSTIPTPPVIEDDRHWQDPGSGYKRSHLDMPEIGRYDSRDPQTIRWQIQQAKSAGLSGFIINWYGQNSVENIITLAVLNEFEQWNREYPDDPVLYFFSIDSQAQMPTEGKTPVTLQEDLRYLKEHLIRTGYLMRGGRPVLSCFPYEDNLPAWIDAIRAVFGETAPDFLWMNEPRGEGETGCFLWVQPDPETIDLSSAYTWSDPENIGDNWARGRYKAWAEARFEHRYGMAGIWPGFNDSLVSWAWKPDAEPGDVRPRIIARETDRGNTYTRMWEAYLDSLRDRSGVRLPLVQVVTWNDWAEATTIEPARGYGRTYLDLTYQYICKARELWNY